MNAAFMDSPDYLFGRPLYRDVFPDPEYLPSRILQELVSMPVSGPISPGLFRPKVGVGLRDCVMFGATVPEATVYKYGEPNTWKDHVRGASHLP